jgi:diacylglycerol O-acyltransferase-1
MFAGVAMMGMLGQIPLIVLTDQFGGNRSYAAKVTGNTIFWVSFCLVGQPLAAMMYFFAWQMKYGSIDKRS